MGCVVVLVLTIVWLAFSMGILLDLLTIIAAVLLFAVFAFAVAALEQRAR